MDLQVRELIASHRIPQYGSPDVINAFHRYKKIPRPLVTSPEWKANYSNLVKAMSTDCSVYVLPEKIIEEVLPLPTVIQIVTGLTRRVKHSCHGSCEAAKICRFSDK